MAELEQWQRDEQILALHEAAVVLPQLDHDALLVKAKAEDKKGRYVFASARKVDIAPHSAGQWAKRGGRAEWDLSLQSEGALSLNFGFSEFRLPPGGELTIRSDETDAVTFTAADNDDHGELWTPLFAGDRVTLALSVPSQLASEVRLRIGKTNHGFRPPTRRKDGKAIGDSSSGSCNIDVICNAENDQTFGPMVDLYRDQIRSVAAYTLGGIETCSGALINNVENDLRPFFLTANHCEINTSNAASIVVYWNFENSFCRTPGSSSSGGNGDGPITEFNSGSVFRAARSNSDFCLIELDDPVDPSTAPYYAGWDRSGDNPPSVVGIHHPGVSEKRISFEMNQTSTTSYYGDSSTSGGTHVRVADWDFGTTEGGSSGSPLFDDKGRIIGQLHGGDAACGNDLPDWYGRVSRSWADGGSSDAQLSSWLDPGDSGVVAIDGTDSDEMLTVMGGSLVEGNEGQMIFEAIVSLNEATTETVTVNLSTQDGSATVAGNDYLASIEALTFAPGETSQVAQITINGDLVPEENESFLLVLSEAVNASVSSQPAEVAILNDDFIAPVIDGALMATAFVSGSFEYRITALNTPTSYAITNAPAGMAVDVVTGVVTWRPLAAGEVTVELVARNSAGSDLEVLRITVLPNALIDAVDLTAGLPLSNAEPGWTLQSATTHDGIDAAQADALVDSEVAAFTVEVSGPDRLSFWAKVSSEENYDFLTVEVNGNEVVSLSGEVDWSERFVNVPAGSQVVTFRYGKDGSVSEGDDTAWVDEFVLASESGKPVIVSPAVLRVDTGIDFSYAIESIDPAAEFTVSGLPAGLSFDGDATVSGAIGSQGSFSFLVESEAAGENDTIMVQIFVTNPLGPALEQESQIWTREGSANWFGQTVVSFDGVDAAQAGMVGSNQSTTMSTRITGPDRMTFRWKVSSEEGFDGMSFTIDGEPVSGVAQISGEVDWAFVAVRIPSGNHLLSWTYSKDEATGNGDDTGWVDDIRFANGGRVVIWTEPFHEVISGREVRIPLEFINEDHYSFSSLPAWLSYDVDSAELVGVPPSEGETVVSVLASNAQGSHGLEFTIVASEPDAALAAAIEQTDLIVTSGGDGTWLVDSLAGTVGGSAARSGAIGDSGQSTMTLRVQGPGTLSFRWMVSSEQDFDFLGYLVNRVFQARISGDVGWESLEVDLLPGVNEIVWFYAKDSSDSAGEDLGRVDQVSLSGYARFLNDAGLDHLSSEPGDDDDGDGLSLLGEYAFLGDPGLADRGEVLKILGQPGDLGLEFLGLGDGGGVTYILESSVNLRENDWDDVTVVPELVVEGDGSRYRYSGPEVVDNLRAQFYRVRATFSTSQ